MALPLALFVFLYVAIIHSYRLCIPSLSKWITKKLNKSSKSEEDKRRTLQNLLDEQTKISMKDEFAKYAKLDRRIKKLKDELKALKQSKVATRFTIGWGVTLALNTIYTIGILGLIWTYRYEPIIQLQQDWIWPLGSIISFPCGIPGSVGITAWLAICTAIVVQMQGTVQQETTKRKDVKAT